MHPTFPQEANLPSKILFKKGAVSDLAKETAAFGPRGMIVHGASFEKNGLKERISEDFHKAGIPADFFCRPQGEPALEEIEALIEKGRVFQASWITGIGGGSVLDLAKAGAGLFHAQEKPAYYQAGGVLTEPGIPFLAVPTTAGSGSKLPLTPSLSTLKKE